MDELLLNAYRWQRQLRNSDYARENWRPSVWTGMAARNSLKAAREDVANGTRRYPASPACISWQKDETAYPGKRKALAHVEKPEHFGLRLVGRVIPDTPRGSVWDNRGDCGWHTDPFGEVFKDGTGLCYGLVFQLPGRKGKARFVAGYEFGGTDGGPTIDFADIEEESAASDRWNINPADYDAARTQARYADSLASSAAEKEREYQTAWQAGSMFGEKGEEIATARKEALALLVELRPMRRKGEAEFPLACQALRKAIARHLETISEARAERAKLASGQWESGRDYLGFYTGDADLRAAFCDGAGLKTFPA